MTNVTDTILRKQLNATQKHHRYQFALFDQNIHTKKQTKHETLIHILQLHNADFMHRRKHSRPFAWKQNALLTTEVNYTKSS